MSLGIAFKGPEGIVLAADSRVTVMALATQTLPPPAPPVQTQIPVMYDNATKMLRVESQKFIGAVTYGVGALGLQAPRTAHSYMPEFDAELAKAGRLTVLDFATRLSAFFLKQWQAEMPQNYVGPDMVFLVGGYNEGEAYGRVYDIFVPSRPQPVEQQADSFGIAWGGQREYTDRLLQGFDERTLLIAQSQLQLTDQQREDLRAALRNGLQIPIPFQLLPLQDSVDLAIFLVRTTISIQSWLIDVRGVGGKIDVVTITRTDGVRTVQQKAIHGEQ
jgi:hypothetical protein